jgi:hypothetical protein
MAVGIKNTLLQRGWRWENDWFHNVSLFNLPFCLVEGKRMNFVFRMVLKIVIAVTLLCCLAYFGLKKLGVEDPVSLLGLIP